ncbi:hypothetical protein R4Y45_06995 [Holzapfeliella sp. He02]|uniref:Major facilitator superfamily (MFS) profile domain-containing protein n=1 Tax=Holzapfeliella saturejae TaxID=3082953 RepID=A0ABU8SI09_9LACO
MSIIGLIMGGIGLITLSDNRSMLLVRVGISILLIGIMTVITNIIISTYIKQQTPIEFQGRISATTSTLASIMSPIGSPIGIIIYGYTFAHLSPTVIYIYSGLIISTISLISKAKKHAQL